jgi:hypothetical protein
LLSDIKATLTSLRASAIRLDLVAIRGIMIGIITARAPQIFEISVTQKVKGCYLWDHFRCCDSFVWKFLRETMKWTLRRSTRAGKKIPDGVTYILTNTYFRLVYTITENHLTITLSVNTDQTHVIYSAGTSETYAPRGLKQVEVVGKDEKRGFTLVVGISMSGEVLPFQAIYAGKTNRSLPSPEAPNYQQATEVLKFRFESGGNNHWSTLSTMKSYVEHILVTILQQTHRQDQSNLCLAD